MVFGFGKGGEKPAPAPQDNNSTIPTETKVPNYLGAEPADKFGAETTYGEEKQFAPKDLILTTPTETTETTQQIDEEPLHKPKNYLDASLPEKDLGNVEPHYSEKELEEKKAAEAEKARIAEAEKARIEAIKQTLLAALESGNDISFKVKIPGSTEGEVIMITLEDIQSVS